MRLTLALALTITACTPAIARQPVADPKFVPVFRENFPDPFILPVDGRYLAYATNADAGRANVQMAESTDLISWKPLRKRGGLYDAMPKLPAWAGEGRTWAPEVIKLGSTYVLYFTANERRTGYQCVGVATAASPLGPFVSPDPAPLVCQRAIGGTIDPSAFRDADGRLYLYYKNDGNNPTVLKPSQLFVQPLSADGLRLEGRATALLQNDQHWEWRVVESPTMVRTPTGQYTLFFSANHFGWEDDQKLSNYAMGYAVCASATGPCTKAPENPILASYNDPARGCLSGPGHQTVFESGGRTMLVFHAWAASLQCGRTNKGRYMYVAPLSFDGAKPVIGRSLRP